MTDLSSSGYSRQVIHVVNHDVMITAEHTPDFAYIWQYLLKNINGVQMPCTKGGLRRALLLTKCLEEQRFVGRQYFQFHDCDVIRPVYLLTLQ